MDNIRNTLRLFEACLKKYCTPLFDRLQEPLKESEVNMLFDIIGVNDPYLKELYLWRNGIPYDVALPTHSFDFCTFGVIPPLDYLKNVLDLESADFWKRSYIPIIASYGGDFLLYESDENTESYGMLFLYSPNLGYVYDQISYYDSLESMVRTIIECFELNAFSYDSQNMILDVINIDMQYSIAAKLNPKSEYWEDYR